MAGMNAADVLVPGMLLPPPRPADVVPLPEPRRSFGSMPAVVDVAVVRGIPLDRPRKVALGLIGDPVPRVSSGAAVSISFWAGPGGEPIVLRVPSAYEAATRRRPPPPDFGPVGR